MTPHKVGVKNMRKVDHKVMLADQTHVVTTVMGDIHGQLCDRHGNDVGKAKLSDVALTQSGFNLFSITKLQLQGWELGGNDKPFG